MLLVLKVRAYGGDASSKLRRQPKGKVGCSFSSAVGVRARLNICFVAAASNTICVSPVTGKSLRAPSAAKSVLIFVAFRVYIFWISCVHMIIIIDTTKPWGFSLRRNVIIQT